MKKHVSANLYQKCLILCTKIPLYVLHNRPFPSFLVPVFENESKCETFHKKMSSERSSIFIQVKAQGNSEMAYLSSTVLSQWWQSGWVPDLSNIKGISAYLWHSIFIFTNGAYAWSNKHIYKYVSLSLSPCLTFFELKITYILKWSGWGLKKSELPWKQNVL